MAYPLVFCNDSVVCLTAIDQFPRSSGDDVSTFYRISIMMRPDVSLPEFPFQKALKDRDLSGVL
jgi:hypothetical protein